MSNFADVGRFHQKFGLPTSGVTVPTSPLDPETLRFRVEFMREELNEFIEAAEAEDAAGMLDALIDLVYVAMGTAHLAGFPWEAGWALVQQANMAKVRATSASESKRGSSLDVVKPEGWTAPDIAGTIDYHNRLAARLAQHRGVQSSGPVL